MAKTKKVENKEEVEINLTTDKTLAEFIDYSLTEGKLTYKEAIKYWKDNRDPSAVNKGFRTTLFNTLIDNDLTLEELKDFIKENGSNNDLKNLKFYFSIVNLVKEVRVAK